MQVLCEAITGLEGKPYGAQIPVIQNTTFGFTNATFTFKMINITFSVSVVLSVTDVSW